MIPAIAIIVLASWCLLITVILFQKIKTIETLSTFTADLNDRVHSIKTADGLSTAIATKFAADVISSLTATSNGSKKRLDALEKYLCIKLVDKAAETVYEGVVFEGVEMKKRGKNVD